MTATPENKETLSSHIPALHILMAMGYEYLPPEACLAKRGKNSEVFLKDELVAILKERRFEYKGETFPLSTNAIDQIVRELASPGLNEGLLAANERIYDKLTLGVTVTEFINGKKHQPTIPIIDWHNIDRNRFHVTDEPEVLNTNGAGTRRPDIVCYVNGIPLVVIEAKRPDAHNPNRDMLSEGISQQIRNQRNGEIPHLFAYSQLLLAINDLDGRYGTTKTLAKFWTRWREEDLGEDFFNKTKNTALSKKQKNELFRHREPRIGRYFNGLWAEPMLPTGQDRMLISLLKPDRLLELIHFFILFDRKTGKIIARYQQAFGVKRLIERVNQRYPRGGRKGGVVWHTTGSGKSFTMVFLCKALLLHDSLKKCRIIVVTDRIDLEKQLSKTFLSGGAFGSEIGAKKDGARAKVRSGKDLAKRIGKGGERIIFSIINKFNTAARQTECYNPSDNIIVLIDEGHRSQGSESHERMRKALPNAAFIAFTGTPLLKGEKTTRKFGPIVHAYTMQRAVEDGTVTPLLYEERRPELDLNEKAIDNWFEKITQGLNDRQKTDLKKKFAKKGAVYGAENRIELIAWDISTHFSRHIKALELGLKGQLATDSKRSAIRYKKYLDRIGSITSAVVISPPDTREGHEDVDESLLPEVQQWWKDNVGTQKDENYTREVVDAFATDEGPDLLVVVDKLLTGFDEPRNAVLYIDKPLKQHNLIQAIARVNRLHEAKLFGLLIDYRGILKELDTAIKDYQDLETRTQGGYDIDDLEGLYHQVSTEYKRLPTLHDKLWSIFGAVQNRQDLEQYRQVLIPKWLQDENHETYDAHQKTRENFYEALTEYGMCLKVALSSRSFYEDAGFAEKDIQTYKKDLQFFTGLRRIARQDALETVDYSSYEKQIRKLVDKQVIGQEVREPDGVYIINELGKEDASESWSDEKTRNETDIIRTRIKRTIEQDLADDPYARQVFSQLLKQAIAEADAMFDHPIKQYALFKKFEEKVEKREIEQVPDIFSNNRHAHAYYGLFRLVIGDDAFEVMEEAEQNIYVNEAFAIDEIVSIAVAEQSLNPQNIETEIRKGLLPRLFKLLGMEKAKEVIERIIQITRVGLSRGEGRK